MYLRDYHRENLLAGNTGDEVEVEDIPQTFVQQQEQLKRSVVKEMHTATEAEVSGDDDEENAFLVRKPSAKKDETEKEIDLPDPSLADKNPEEFLNKFLASRAWTKTSASAYVPIESDDSEEEAMADQYEFNYNMRFEDPDAAARAKIVSYGRDAISENTVRREEKSRRKRAREEKRKRKEEEKAQREIEKGRLRKLKTEELMEKFKLVREAAELSEGDEEAEAAVLNKLLEGDFSDGEWDQWMQERFGDKYYKKDGRPKKPHFDDDIDIGDIVPDFEDDLVNDDDDEGVEVEDEEMQDANDADEQQPNKKKSKKEIIKEKQARKAKDRSTRRKVERFVEDNFDFDSELPGGNSSGFRYRETTPEAYGLGTLDILAADDTDLNQYAGLKKYAAFRDAEKKKKDKKRYAKKKLLKQWRKEVFGDANGVQMPPEWKPEGLVAIKAETAEAGKLDIRESGDGERKKKRRKKNKAKA
ncbi:Krr1-domain-containing protein [Wilcoxina mikolae CBS 423.85]|nr:Krr1-domain-containing protein [Wilcoxina mikolae CBS 423.85]